jgi:hypothetical protein
MRWHQCQRNEFIRPKKSIGFRGGRSRVAGMTARHVRFTPKSGHWLRQLEGPLSAKITRTELRGAAGWSATSIYMCGLLSFFSIRSRQL